MSIRVCHVMSADLWAGAEIQLATLASYLVTRPDIDMAAVLFNEGALARELRRLGIATVVIDEQKNSAIRIVTRLVSFLKRHKVDLVHTHRYKDNILGTVAAKTAGVRHIVRTVHGVNEAMVGWPQRKFESYDLVDRAVLRCAADRIIAVSHRMSQQLVENGHTPSKVVSIHNGVNLSTVEVVRTRQEVRAEFGIAPDAILIGTTGRLAPVKGHAVLLRAATIIRQRTPDVRFILVGDGPLEHELEGLASAQGLGNACVFTGARTDIPDLLAAMDIFTLPSLSEGVPMALLEAMVLGVPVVAASVGGVPEVVTHGETGLLVRSGDEYALANACIELVKDRRRAASLAATGKSFVQAHFSHDRNGAAVAALYHAVCRPGAVPQTQVVRPLPARAHTIEPPIESPGVLRFTWQLGCGFAHVATRRVIAAVDAWRLARRMRKVRRDPSALRRALRSAGKILVVCHGNIIRSPFAARLVAEALRDHPGIAVRSGGLAAIAGKPSHPRAVVAASKQRIDLTGHHAAPLDEQVVNASDVIFVMEVPHLIAIRRRFPSAEQKTFLLTCLASDTPLEIQDPYDGDASRFDACFDHIVRAVDPIVRTLSNTAA